MVFLSLVSYKITFNAIEFSWTIRNLKDKLLLVSQIDRFFQYFLNVYQL